MTSQYKRALDEEWMQITWDEAAAAYIGALKVLDIKNKYTSTTHLKKIGAGE